MYSRSMEKPMPGHIGARVPSYRQVVKIPPNYGGIAIGPPLPDGVPPVVDGLLPEMSSDMPPTKETPASDESIAEPFEEDPKPFLSEERDEEAEVMTRSPKAVSLSHGILLKHGMGYEELILMGLILLLLWEGDMSEDNDLSMTLILLGALLFMG